MAIKPDTWIRRKSIENKMIQPFSDGQAAKGVISYGLSSYGYDLRLANEFRIFTPRPAARSIPRPFPLNATRNMRAKAARCRPEGTSWAEPSNTFVSPATC